MLQMHTHNFRNIYRLYDLQGKFMPSAGKAEWLISTCLNQAGSSGRLYPGTYMCLPE